MTVFMSKHGCGVISDDFVDIIKHGDYVPLQYRKRQFEFDVKPKCPCHAFGDIMPGSSTTPNIVEENGASDKGTEPKIKSVKTWKIITNSSSCDKSNPNQSQKDVQWEAKRALKRFWLRQQKKFKSIPKIFHSPPQSDITTRKITKPNEPTKEELETHINNGHTPFRN